MTLEGATLLELHSSVSVASGMSHHEYNQTAVSYSSQFLTNQKLIQVWQLQFKVACPRNIGDMCIHSKMTVQCKTQIFDRLFEGNLSITNSDRSR